MTRPLTILFLLVVSWLGCDADLQKAGVDAGNDRGSDLQDPAEGGPLDTDVAAVDAAGIDRLPAAGIRIVAVTANQAVEIKLARNGAIVPTANRVAPLISGRGMLLRVEFAIDEGFDARRVDGLLSLTQQDGTSKLLTDSRVISGPPTMDELDGTFSWFVDAADLRAATRFSILLAEPQTTAANSSSSDTTGARFPQGGDLPFDAWGEPMELDIVLVPYDCGGGRAAHDLSAGNLKDFEDYLYNTYPVQRVNLTVHDVLAPSSCDEFEVAEKDLPALREAENAPPHVYYGGLLNGDGGGYAIASEGSDKMDHRRTFALNTWRDYGLTFDLFAHELGHNHGRKHTFEDSSYPWANEGVCGARQYRGFGVRASSFPQSSYSNDQGLGIAWIDPHATLLLPTDPDDCAGHGDGNRSNWNDFMSYTYPYWVSAYTYAALAERVKLVSSWPRAAPPKTVSLQLGRTLRALVSPSGTVTWTHSRGASAVAAPAGYARCSSRGKTTRRFALRAGRSHRERLDDSGALELQRYTTLEVPMAGGLFGDRCVLYYQGRLYAIDLATL